MIAENKKKNFLVYSSIHCETLCVCVCELLEVCLISPTAQSVTSEGTQMPSSETHH